MDTFAREEPRVKPLMPQGTYLQWLDCRALGLGKDALEDLMIRKAKVYFDEGYIFGNEGIGFERINIACPRSVLKQALDRMIAAMKTV